ncbi:MAG: cytochrome c oxidase assembly protein, partial [Alphaproteobacteria bacterium]|nr:cytochrome c oxidase assembly protein [Alphaproteobacteria bacterium]
MHHLTARLRAPWRELRIAAGAAGLLLASGGAAFADDSARLTDATAWKAWDFTPDIVIATALVVAIYVSGMVRRRDAATPVPMARHALFFGGVAAVFISLQSPIDAIADRLFLVHQIQHLLLRMVGPMLLALSAPEALLTAGLPQALRRKALAPAASNRAVRALFGVLGHPAVATLLFIAALYVWELPRLHDYAV